MLKKTIKTDAKNYWPISLLLLISKVVQKWIHDQTQDYLQRNVLLYIYQSSFRANHSTDRCLSRLTDMLLIGAKNGKYAGMIFIDLRKAFDTLDQKILLDKIKCSGFSDKTIKWFHSYHGVFFVSLDVFGSRAHKTAE